MNEALAARVLDKPTAEDTFKQNMGALVQLLLPRVSYVKLGLEYNVMNMPITKVQVYAIANNAVFSHTELISFAEMVAVSDIKVIADVIVGRLFSRNDNLSPKWKP